ncbi:MAG: glycine cleavage system aminomethyltransferase GcvT [Clostridiales bacterium]|nr:glycine cleavage system aminomethyltransferase GcvT [Clostridiales bacterium]
MERKTPLYDRHISAGGKLVPFGGYLLPVQYGAGIIAEHMAVRERAGLFDVSHMGEVLIEGPDALANLNRLMTNDFTNLRDGGVRYSLMCNEQGGAVDDLIVYRHGPEQYMVVVNASNRGKDVAWMKAHLQGEATLTDISDIVALLALQGPHAADILRALADPGALPKKAFTFVEELEVGGIPCIVSKTGYTGSDGYELYTDANQAVALWDALLAAGAPQGLIPCGLGARDTLRLEAGMPLYGHELGEDITPLEAGLGFAVKLDKPDFIGRQALLERGEPQRLRAGLRVVGRGIVREQAPVFLEGEPVGITTSGTHCPYVGEALAMALLDRRACAVGQALEAEVRGRRIAVEVVKLPFYQKPGK